jgi:hypothetical protein
VQVKKMKIKETKKKTKQITVEFSNVPKLENGAHYKAWLPRTKNKENRGF